jgi:membrane-associated protease RseP (regulator of RpoE activity)
MKAGARPKRTIRFMLWSGEEQGLLGSEGYVKAHPELMDKVSAVLVHDGGTNYLSGLSVTPEMADAAKRALEPVFDLDPSMPFGLYYADGLRPGGSDHTPFIAAGVPGFFWHQAGKADYDRSHHTQYDLWDAMVPEYQQHSAMVVALAAWGFANLDEPLDRTDSKPLGVSRRLGVQLDDNRLTEVMDDSNAARLGMKVGDVIVKMDGKDMKTMMDIVRSLRAKGDKRVIVFKRGKRTKTVTLDFDAGPIADERRARKARRAEKFGELDYEKPFAGREPPKEHQDEPDEEEKPKKPESAPAAAPVAPAPPG